MRPQSFWTIQHLIRQQKLPKDIVKNQLPCLCISFANAYKSRIDLGSADLSTETQESLATLNSTRAVDISMSNGQATPQILSRDSKWSNNLPCYVVNFKATTTLTHVDGLPLNSFINKFNLGN